MKKAGSFLMPLRPTTNHQPPPSRNGQAATVVAMFQLKNDATCRFLFDALTANNQPPTANDIFILAWTTTPWTLPSNLGLAVGPNIDYVVIQTFNPYTHKA